MSLTWAKNRCKITAPGQKIMCEKALKPHGAKEEPNLWQKLVLITQIFDNILLQNGLLAFVSKTILLYVVNKSSNAIIVKENSIFSCILSGLLKTLTENGSTL